MLLSEFLKPLSYIEITNHHEKILKNEYKGFNNSIKIFNDLDKTKVPLLENICNLKESKIMDNFVQEKINEIKVVRLTTPCIQNYKK
jgi:hypothetical protein